MRRCLYAVVLMPFVLIGARADYLVIKVDVNKAFVSADGKGQVLMPMPRKEMKGGVGFPKGGFPGGMPGGTPGGTPGGMPGGFPGGMPKGPGGFFPGGGQPGGGMPGGINPKGGGGFPANPGGGFPKGPGGNPMNPGTNPGGIPMNPGGFPNPNQPPNPGQGIPGQGTPGQGKPGTVDNTPPRWAFAYLELRGRTAPVFTMDKLTHIAIEHPWGKNCVIPIEHILYINKDATPTDYAKRAKALSREGKTPAKALRLAEWALAHGLMKEFHAAMNDVKVFSEKPPEKAKEKPAEVPAAVKAALAAYYKVKENLKKAPDADDPLQADLANDLKAEGYQTNQSAGGHYNMLTNVAAADVVKRRLALLEDTYEKFFYWFALRSPDSVPPMPKHRLTAVLVNGAKEFIGKHAVWGGLPLVGDGFLPRRDNVIVMCAEHLDETYGLLRKNNQGFCQTLRMSSDDLLSGAVWGHQDARKNDLNVAMLQTLMLVEKATEAQAERTTISHEATRQLLFATGLLPRNVAVPEWIQYGLSSFFETPPGAFYPGVGITSWSNLVDFKYHKRKKHLGEAKEALGQMAGDGFFQKAKASAAYTLVAGDKPGVIERASRDQEIARSTAWAFVYYLARENKLGSLRRYSQELDRLPRDLELNERILRGCFNRAFDLTDGNIAGFADAWFAEMNNYVLEMPAEYEDALLKSRLEGTAIPVGSR